MTAPYDLKNIPASALPEFPFEDAARQLIGATQCTREEAEVALAGCIVHSRPLSQVARDRFTEIWLGHRVTVEDIERFLRMDTYAEYVRKHGSLIEVHYRGSAWTCEVNQVGKRDLYWT